MAHSARLKGKGWESVCVCVCQPVELIRNGSVEIFGRPMWPWRSQGEGAWEGPRGLLGQACGQQQWGTIQRRCRDRNDKKWAVDVPPRGLERPVRQLPCPGALRCRVPVRRGSQLEEAVGKQPVAQGGGRGDGGVHSSPANDHCKWQWALWEGHRWTEGKRLGEGGSKLDRDTGRGEKARRGAREAPP